MDEAERIRRADEVTKKVKELEASLSVLAYNNGTRFDYAHPGGVEIEFCVSKEGLFVREGEPGAYTEWARLRDARLELRRCFLLQSVDFTVQFLKQLDSVDENHGSTIVTADRALELLRDGKKRK